MQRRAWSYADADSLVEFAQGSVTAGQSRKVGGEVPDGVCAYADDDVC